jgi:hypothetical protein
MMRTISQALKHPLITVLEREKTPGIFRVQFGIIATPITIEIIRLDDGRYTSVVSHGIKTETQIGAYWVRHGVYETPGEALDHFRSAFAMYYRSAEEDGFHPNETWLIPSLSI